MKIDDAFTFGKFNGTTPRELIHKKKGLYLMWCLNNIRGFHIEPESVEIAIRDKFKYQYLRVYGGLTTKNGCISKNNQKRL